MGNDQASPINKGASEISWCFDGPESVSSIRSANQSKNNVPFSRLSGGPILNEAIFKMWLLDSLSAPASSIRATRNVEPPTSRARKTPRSSPDGSRELYDGSMHSGLSTMLSRNCFRSPSDNATSRGLSTELLKAFSTPSKNCWEPGLPTLSSASSRSMCAFLMTDDDVHVLRMAWSACLVLGKVL